MKALFSQCLDRSVTLYDAPAGCIFTHVFACTKEVDEELTALDEWGAECDVYEACALYIHMYSMTSFPMFCFQVGKISSMVIKEAVHSNHSQVDWDEKYEAVSKYDVSCRVRTYKYLNSGDVLFHGRVIEDDSYNRLDIYKDSPKTRHWTDEEIKDLEREVMDGLNALCDVHYKKWITRNNHG